jgi:hypothetical protein
MEASVFSWRYDAKYVKKRITLTIRIKNTGLKKKRPKDKKKG